VADPQTNMMSQCGNSNVSNLNPQCVLDNQMAPNPTHVQTMHHADDMVINIQLPYNSSTPMKSELWDGSFYPISLHSLIKHLVSDLKNIKDFLNFMAKYISNKQVDSSKSNDLEDFYGMGKVVWNFISSVYQANWDFLYANKQSNSLRKKIVAKFTPKIQPTTNKNKIIDKLTLVNIERISPPISVKSQKEVNQISKYFKNIKPANNTKQPQKLYAQALKQNISMSEVIKIKEAFSTIGTNKIEQINNIIKSNTKAKPHIQMMMKEPSRKHIIIFMSSENNMKFMKNSSIHVTNINKSLRNAKSEVLVNFIWSDPLEITVVTNKISLQLDLQIIEQYVKNADDIDALQVKVS